MFLHTNFKPKWDLQLPDDMCAYTRRWAVLQPGNRTFLDEAFLDLDGRDPEMEVRPLRRPLCRPLRSAVCNTPSKCSGPDEMLCLRFPEQWVAALDEGRHKAHPAPLQCVHVVAFTGCIMTAV